MGQQREDAIKRNGLEAVNPDNKLFRLEALRSLTDSQRKEGMAVCDVSQRAMLFSIGMMSILPALPSEDARENAKMYYEARREPVLS